MIQANTGVALSWDSGKEGVGWSREEIRINEKKSDRETQKGEKCQISFYPIWSVDEQWSENEIHNVNSDVTVKDGAMIVEEMLDTAVIIWFVAPKQQILLFQLQNNVINVVEGDNHSDDGQIDSRS